MFGKIAYGILGLLVGLTIILGSWAVVIGLCWLVSTIFLFTLTIIRCADSVVKWTVLAMLSIPTLLISQVVGSNIVGKYIRVK